MKKIVLIAVTAALTLTMSPVFAGNTNDPGVNKREHHQAQRIKQGVRTGELTGRETYALGKQQLRIRKKERRFKSDGKLTKRERVILHRDLNRSSRRIYNQKHD